MLPDLTQVKTRRDVIVEKVDKSGDEPKLIETIVALEDRTPLVFAGEISAAFKQAILEGKGRDYVDSHHRP
jgi:hypothetical protein